MTVLEWGGYKETFLARVHSNLSHESLFFDRFERLTDMLVEVTRVTRDPSQAEVGCLSDFAHVDAGRQFRVPSRVVLLSCLPDLTAHGRGERGRVVEERDGGRRVERASTSYDVVEEQR